MPSMHKTLTSTPLKKGVGGEERDGSAVQALATEPDGLASVSKTHVVGESRLLKVSTSMHWHTCTHNKFNK